MSRELGLWRSHRVETPAGIEHVLEQLAATVLDVAQIRVRLAPLEVARKGRACVDTDECGAQEREVVNAQSTRGRNDRSACASGAARAFRRCRMKQGGHAHRPPCRRAARAAPALSFVSPATRIRRLAQVAVAKRSSAITEAARTVLVR